MSVHGGRGCCCQRTRGEMRGWRGRRALLSMRAAPRRHPTARQLARGVRRCPKPFLARSRARLSRPPRPPGRRNGGRRGWARAGAGAAAKGRGRGVERHPNSAFSSSDVVDVPLRERRREKTRPVRGHPAIKLAGARGGRACDCLISSAQRRAGRGEGPRRRGEGARTNTKRRSPETKKNWVGLPTRRARPMRVHLMRAMVAMGTRGSGFVGWVVGSP